MQRHEQETWAYDAAQAIRDIEESLLELETDPANREEIHRLYRGLHTIKGNSGFLSLSSIERVAHACEDLVSLVRDGALSLDTAMVNLVLDALDCLRASVDFVAREGKDVPAEDVADVVRRLRDEYADRGGKPKETLGVAFQLFDDEEGPAAGIAIAIEAETVTDITEEAMAPPAVASPNDSSAAAGDAPSRSCEVEASAGEGPRAPNEKKPAEPRATSDGRASARRGEFLTIDAAKVAALMDLAGELGLACSAVTRHPEVAGRDFEGFATSAHKLELLVREIQNDLSGLRLVPVAGVFQRMKRVVRDAAMRTGKKIDFVIQGEETEVDKVMLDALQDPLVHVLRNAVDHGIEAEEVRAAAGKPPVGKITLSAIHRGGEVTVEVRDDGRGLDRERILTRARERRLVPPGVVPTDEEILSFVFAPGFSTKEVVDELSGRGVGMDVLKTTIENLRGRVDLRSVPGAGSSIHMTMPLTLAFVDAMVVRSRERLFALPIEKVFEVSKIDPAQVFTNSADGQTMLRVRGSRVPVLWLHRFWEEEPDHGPGDGGLDDRTVVVVQTTRGALALPVDELIGNQQIMLKPLRGVLTSIRAAAGCGMLRTGDVAVAIDCDRLHA